MLKLHFSQLPSPSSALWSGAGHLRKYLHIIHSLFYLIKNETQFWTCCFLCRHLIVFWILNESGNFWRLFCSILFLRIHKHNDNMDLWTKSMSHGIINFQLQCWIENDSQVLLGLGQLRRRKNIIHRSAISLEHEAFENPVVIPKVPLFQNSQKLYRVPWSKTTFQTRFGWKFTWLSL